MEAFNNRLKAVKKIILVLKKQIKLLNSEPERKKEHEKLLNFWEQYLDQQVLRVL